MLTRHRGIPGALLLVLLLSISNGMHSQSGKKPAFPTGLRYRMIGPERGGRVTAVTGVPSEPMTFYMGSTGGGIWKTTDAGHHWVNISDGQLPVGSMGAIDVSLSDPRIIYAGTGSSKIRSNVSIGRGIYKSTDAGNTWTFSGLRDTGQIATVRVHPSNPDLVYVASIGNPFAPNKDRGVFRSTDGGKHWSNVLYVSDDLGAADIELQPGHPEVIFATVWHGLRKPWTIISGSRDGGIYKSTDGGDHWAKLSNGLPHELFGRANVAISAANPNRIYALIEAKPGSGLYRSEDSGASWTLVNGARNLTTRPFYYDTLGVDPNNADVVYVGNEGWFKSIDAGKSFQSAPVPHGDNHELWINPKNSDYMIQANDGGANVSLDGGRSWSTQANQPTAEIYQVAVDNQYPYRVYGAQQDNTTVIAPSLALPTGQPFRIGPGCETGPIMPNLKNPQIVYGACKGQFSKLDINTHDEQQYWIGGQSLYGNPGSELTYRFQRVSPMDTSPFDPNTVYYGSQYVHRTRDGGVNWDRISPDLTAHPEGTQGASGEPITRDATGEEIYSTLYSIRESPVQKGLIWTGSNDGMIWVTRDDGKTWKDVTPKGLKPGGRVQNVEPSPHRPGTAYAAIYRFLLGGDFAPYIYRTDDYGASWTCLTDRKNGIAADEPTRVVREDPGRAHMLYAGTEFGMYISFDDGAQWQSLQLNLPATPVTDMKLAHNDLILSTQGRGFWILDNVSDFRELEGNSALSSNILFTPVEGIRSAGRVAGSPGRSASLLQFPSPGAAIDYYLPAAPEGDIALDILDKNGTVVRSFSSKADAAAERAASGAETAGEDEDSPRVRSGPPRLDKSAGMHRFIWDLRYPGPWISNALPQGPNGPMVPPDRYSVRLTVGSWTNTKPVTVKEDPRVVESGVTDADLRTQFEHNMRVRDLVSDVNRTVARVREAEGKSSGDQARLKELASHLVTPPIRYSKPELQTHISYLYGMTNNSDQKIGRDAVERYAALRKELDARTVELNGILGSAQ